MESEFGHWGLTSAAATVADNRPLMRESTRSVQQKLILASEVVARK